MTQKQFQALSIGDLVASNIECNWTRPIKNIYIKVAYGQTIAYIVTEGSLIDKDQSEGDFVISQFSAQFIYKTGITFTTTGC